MKAFASERLLKQHLKSLPNDITYQFLFEKKSFFRNSVFSKEKKEYLCKGSKDIVTRQLKNHINFKDEDCLRFPYINLWEAIESSCGISFLTQENSFRYLFLRSIFFDISQIKTLWPSSGVRKIHCFFCIMNSNQVRILPCYVKIWL